MQDFAAAFDAPRLSIAHTPSSDTQKPIGLHVGKSVELNRGHVTPRRFSQARMNVASSSRSQLLRWPATAVTRAQCLRRSFATEVQPQPSFTDSAATTEISTTTSPAQNNTAQWKKDGRLRPQRQSSQPIDPNHPLYAFFRKDTKESSSEGDEAPAKYLPFEPYWAKEFETGSFMSPFAVRNLYLAPCIVQVDRGLRVNSGGRVSRTCMSFGMSSHGSGISWRHSDRLSRAMG